MIFLIFIKQLGSKNFKIFINVVGCILHLPVWVTSTAFAFNHDAEREPINFPDRSPTAIGATPSQLK